MKRAILFGVVICCFLLIGTSSIQPITANKSIQEQEKQIIEDSNYYINKLNEIKEKIEVLKCKECNKDRFPIFICGLILIFLTPFHYIIQVLIFIFEFDFIDQWSPPLLSWLFAISIMTVSYLFEFAETIGCDVWP